MESSEQGSPIRGRLEPERDPTDRFSSIVELQDTHDHLLGKRDALPSSAADQAAFWEEVHRFVSRAQNTGAWLDVSRDRRIAQSVLDYWASALYRADQSVPNARLAEFDPSLAPQLPDEPCPYQGLAAFPEPKSPFFFGRDSLIRRATERLQNRERFLAVVGESGSGKSSFVLAGLAPRLRNGRIHPPGSCRVVTMVPGSNPFANLTKALVKEFGADQKLSLELKARLVFAADGCRRESSYLAALMRDLSAEPVALVVDQFEEIFTLGGHASSDRDPFVTQLLGVTESENRQDVAIVTLRTDFTDTVVRVPGLRDRFEAAKLDVGALDLNELRAAIEMPAAQVGLRFEEGIVDDLITTILGERAGLPLLQFALLKLWKARQRNRITRQVYQAVGNPREALGRAADAFYRDLLPQDQATARRILLKMVRPTEGREFTSNRIPRVEVFREGEARDRVERVLGELVAEGLVKESPGETEGDAQIEVAHEALVRNWPLLAGWLDDERVELRQRRLLTDRARAWKEGRASLLRVRELEDAARLDDLDSLEREFVGASREAMAREEQEKEAMRLKEIETKFREESRQRELEQSIRQVRRAQRTAMVMIILAGIALAAGALAIAQKRRATASEQRALANEIQARASDAKAQENELQARVSALTANVHAELARPERDSAIALLLAREAVAQSRRLSNRPSVDLFATLASAVDNAPPRVRTVTVPDFSSFDLCADGKSFVTGAFDGTIRRWDLETGQERRLFGQHEGPVWAVACSGNGRVMSGGQDNLGRLWDLETGQQIRVLGDLGTNVASVAISPDGKWGLTSADTNAVLWDLEDGRKVRTYVGHTEPVLALAFRWDGNAFLTASSDRTARLWYTAGGTEPVVFRGHSGAVSAVAFSPTGDKIATGSWDNTARLWDADTGAPISRLHGHQNSVQAVAFNPRADHLVTGSFDGSVRIWDAESGQALREFPAHSGPVLAVRVSTSGESFITAGEDATVRQWDWEQGGESQLLRGHQSPVSAVVFSPDSTRVFTASWDKVIKAWDAVTGKSVASFEGHDDIITSMAISRDGNLLLTGSWDKTARLWEVSSGKFLRSLTGHGGWIYAVAFCPDGSRAATASQDGTARVWDVSTGQELLVFRGHPIAVKAVAYSPDGKNILTGAWDGAAKLWDAQTGQEKGTFRGHQALVSAVAFSPDGRQITTGSGDKTTILWDVDTVQQRKVFRGHQGEVTAVAFSPDGKRIVTASDDRTAKLWNVDTGSELRTARGHTASVLAVAFQPDGKSFATAAQDYTARIWTTEIDEMMVQALRRIHRDPPGLTPEERERYGLLPKGR
ncbi:MAG TPA: hypothetical protein PLX89_18300 [Verrucomicrobiota bacterium]|nr:hypothetical protein [Verrucomicrobiota bacterium]